MTLYVCVSIAGSIPVILCLILWILQKQAYNFYLGKGLLLTGMFFYLFPFQIVKHILPKQTAPVLSLPLDVNVEQNFYEVMPVKSTLSPERPIWIPKWVFAILILWLGCIIIFSAYQIVKYRIDIRKLLAHSEKAVVEVNGKTVEVLVNNGIRTPYTVGFIKPSIIVPKGSIRHPCFSMFYQHENQHRKNHDSLMKLICIIIICIHWINPVAILLLFLYSVTAEYICDARATEGCTNDEKKKYAQVLVELSAVDEPLSCVWRNNLSGSEKLMKRRINYMMKKKGMVRRGVVIAISVLTVFASAGTIFAYEPMLSTNENAIEAFNGEEFGNYFNNDIADDIQFGDSDYIFVYEDGTQIAVNGEISAYALCNHILDSGYYSTHKSDGSGGCRVKVYNAKRCSRCGYIEIGSLHNTITYAVCIHK